MFTYAHQYIFILVCAQSFSLHSHLSHCCYISKQKWNKIQMEKKWKTHKKAGNFSEASRRKKRVNMHNKDEDDDDDEDGGGGWEMKMKWVSSRKCFYFALKMSVYFNIELLLLRSRLNWLLYSRVLNFLRRALRCSQAEDMCIIFFTLSHLFHLFWDIEQDA